ncbi:MAG TPA: hypothetical protein PKW16_11720 [Treponemataceae bacterium]|nr:hypothetical protein [Treponemataceae bacterium]
MDFLTRFKDLLAKGLVVFETRNRKTSDFMRNYALYFEDVKEILEELEPSEVYEGPSADHNGSPGEVMVFLHDWEHLKLYIKLKVVTLQDGNTGAILSVHEEGLYD